MPGKYRSKLIRTLPQKSGPPLIQTGLQPGHVAKGNPAEPF